MVRARALLRSGSGRVIRDAAGVGLGEFAAMTGLQIYNLSKWERGLHTPRPQDALIYLAAIEALQR